MKPTIKVTGIAELQAKFSQLTDKRLDKILFKALRAGAEIERAEIQQNAPTAEIPPSSGSDALPQGALAADIEMHAIRTKEGEPAYWVVPGKLTAHVARWVEYGHALIRGGYSRLITKGANAGRRRGPGAVAGQVPPHPFLRPSWEAAEAPAQAAIRASLAKSINSIRVR